jgi:CRP/FNR family cyclic AMP-dependent transcriptional regulator
VDDIHPPPLAVWCRAPYDAWHHGTGPREGRQRRRCTTADSQFAVEALKRCALFAEVEDTTLAAIAQTLRVRRFRRGEVIFHQGDPGDSLHIIESGAVKIALPSPEGAEAIIATLRRGDFFGELALLDGAPRSASAAALEPTETLVLSREQFHLLIETAPGLRDALYAALAHELRRLTGHVEELHFLDLAGRLAMRLARLARDTGPADGGEIRLDWPFTQEDLANMIGGTRQSVNRLLSGLVEDGLIRIERDTLVITDVDRLARSAER